MVPISFFSVPPPVVVVAVLEGPFKPTGSFSGLLSLMGVVIFFTSSTTLMGASGSGMITSSFAPAFQAVALPLFQ